jgi:hypothetical protein
MLAATVSLAILALIVAGIWWRTTRAPVIEDEHTTIIDDIALARFAVCGSAYGDLDENHE